jgi:hypothetical protein
VKDGFRLRGGFSVNGGIMFLPNTPHLGPAFGFAGRIGAQFNHYFALVYQNTPMVTLTAQENSDGTSGGSFAAGFVDYNSLMAMVTLLHMFDLGAGPSLDFLAVANGGASIGGGGVVPLPSTSSSSSSGVVFGMHGRFAINIGGLSGNGPRRSGFAIGIDAHPLFTGAGKGLSLTAGLGAEWY